MTDAAAFFELVTRQRACRTFRDDEVSDAIVERLIAAATRAPSAENRQPWEFVVVRDEARRRAVHALTTRGWEEFGRAFERDRLEPALLEDVEAGMSGGFAAAPVTIVVCANTERGLRDTTGSSIFPAVQNLLLGATALGLGSALTTIATAFTTELRELLGLPAHIDPMAVIPIGHPARAMGPSRREPFTERTHRERYGTAWH